MRPKPGQVPPVVPYARPTGGPVRVLHLETRRGMLAAATTIVTIDGSSYPQPWGRTAFELPADRPVAVQVSQAWRNGTVGLASLVVGPGPDLALEYRGPSHFAMAGELGAPGAVRHRGTALQASLLGCVGLLLLGLLALVVALVLTGL
ncbi:hypothetical protein RDV89_02435 [Nocardioides zeae]|uniref:DUF3592 domain-containing protein n=1 Tax=Nocardioides imazamoxiresistens TaxID=3231893 RepID=A0ABU3PRQ7_9ACTN|nr:hypothetical protein [Nocardioides zeae]MDT9591909.1 hypothetical protein [Nocardioides zeae]